MINLRFWKKEQSLFRAFGLKDVSCTSQKAIQRMVEAWEKEIDKEYCLDIGTSERSHQYNTVDFVEGADYIGDIRGLFAPQGGYETTESLRGLPEEFFTLVRMSHLVEHVEWLYQRQLFEWVFEFLADGGHLVLDTPNLDYIVDTYRQMIVDMKKGKVIQYPSSDHPDFVTEGQPIDLVGNCIPWVNYKLYSGCSFDGVHNDYHHTCFNIYWLSLLLEQVGFTKIRIYNGRSIFAVATKPPNGDEGWGRL